MYRILIADDEVIERTVLEKRLKRIYGDSSIIFTAPNGREALELYETKRPRILIFDIEMPGISGLEAAARIREKDADCSIIFLTAYDEFSYAKKAFSVRALDYLLKPCDEEELVNAVDEAMRICDEKQMTSFARAGESALSRPGPEQNAQSLMEQENGGKAGNPELVKEPALFAARTLSEDNSSTGGQYEAISRFIEDNYMKNLSVQDVADYLGYSEAYFCRLFKQHFGHSFVSYLTEYRMTKAQKLMSDSSMSIKEIGKAVGYTDPNYFAKVFRRVRGVSPSEFRSGPQH